MCMFMNGRLITEIQSFSYMADLYKNNQIIKLSYFPFCLLLLLHFIICHFQELSINITNAFPLCWIKYKLVITSICTNCNDRI